MRGRIPFILPVALALLLSLTGCQVLARTPVVRNLPGVAAVAGPVPPLFRGNILGLRVPVAVAVSPDGERLYVAEGDGDREVKVIDLAAGTVAGSLNSPGTTPGQRKPMAIAVSPRGIVFVVDRLRLVVDLYGPDGQWLGILPDPDRALGPWQPLGLGMAQDGSLYVLNGAPEGPAIAQYTPEARLMRTIPLPADSLSFPSGLALSREDYVFISDSNNGRIVVVNQDGGSIQTYGNTVGPGALAIPRGIVIDRSGFCYVTDATDHTVKVWDVTTEPATYLFLFGEPGFADAQLLYPNGVAVDDRGNVYIADTGNDRVTVWSY